jgi:hypothetical protein
MPTGNYIIEIISEENRITQKLLINKWWKLLKLATERNYQL